MKAISLISILSLFFISACSTPKSHPPRFYGYTPTEQALIRKGKIAVGFDEDQVRMAWGDPDNITTGLGTYFWEYKKLKTNSRVVQSVGNSIIHGTVRNIPGNPVYDSLSKRATFNNETRTVSGFRNF